MFLLIKPLGVSFSVICKWKHPCYFHALLSLSYVVQSGVGKELSVQILYSPKMGLRLYPSNNNVGVYYHLILVVNKMLSEDSDLILQKKQHRKCAFGNFVLYKQIWIPFQILQLSVLQKILYFKPLSFNNFSCIQNLFWFLKWLLTLIYKISEFSWKLHLILLFVSHLPEFSHMATCCKENWEMKYLFWVLMPS